MTGHASIQVRCNPGVENQVHSAVKGSLNDPDIFPGFFAEYGPNIKVEVVTLSPGLVEVQLFCNEEYFDGETEIMQEHAERQLARLKTGLW